MKEIEIIKAIQQMCDQSLSPDVHEKWLHVKKDLMNTRKFLKAPELESKFDFIYSKFFWMIVSMVLVVLFGSLSTHSNFIQGYKWADYALIPPVLYLLIITILMIFFAIKNLFSKGGKDAA